MKLRRYQKQLTDKILTTLETENRLCFQLPTGGGKTVIFSHIAKHYLDNNHHVLLLAHREELIYQAFEKLTLIVPDVKIGIIKSGEKADYDAPIQIASVQSLTRRLANLPSDYFNLIICDESHHATSNTYLKIFDHFSTAKLLGVTATPSRLDGKGLNKVFDSLLCADDEGVNVSFLIRNKYLASFRAYAAPKQMNIKNVRSLAGDYDMKEVAEKNNAIKLSGDLVNSYRKLGKNGKCIVFAINCEHSRVIVETYNKAGYVAAHLDGTTPKEERRKVLQKFRNGEIQILSNVGLFDEGFDLPSANVVQIARPTKSLNKHLQIIGRVLRRDGNNVAIIIDHTNNIETLGLPTRKRKWSLNGICKRTNSMVKTVKRKDGSLIEALNVEHEEVKLRRVRHEEKVKQTLFEQQREMFERLVETMEKRNYKRGWLFYRLKDMNPMYEIWQLAAEQLGYYDTWAKHKFLESQNIDTEKLTGREFYTTLNMMRQLYEQTHQTYA